MSKMTHYNSRIKRTHDHEHVEMADHHDEINDQHNMDRQKMIDDNCDNEFMPVTKRMNHLSIENTNSNDTSSINNVSITCNYSSSSSSTTSSLPNEDDSNDSGYYYQGPMLNSHNIKINNGNHQHTSPSPSSAYNPSLKLEQNPIYYDANRILYEAHQMRLLRCNMR